MYDGFSFDDNEGFHDDLSDKPLMQRLWAGKDLKASSEELRKPTEKLSMFLGCNSFADYEIGRVLKVINEKMPYGVSMMIIITISTTRVFSALIHPANSSACSGS